MALHEMAFDEIVLPEIALHWVAGSPRSAPAFSLA
jgi:hypothetical protein